MNFQKQTTHTLDLKFIVNCEIFVLITSILVSSAVCFVGKRDVCAAITCSLGGLSTVAMLCGNVLGLSNVIVSSLSPCSRSCTISSKHVCQVYVFFALQNWFSYPCFLPFGNSSLNLAFPKKHSIQFYKVW